MDLSLLPENVLTGIYSVSDSATIRLAVANFDSDNFDASTLKENYSPPDNDAIEFHVALNPKCGPEDGPHVTVHFIVKKMDRAELVVRHSVSVVDANGAKQRTKDFLFCYKQALVGDEYSTHQLLSHKAIKEAADTLLQNDNTLVVRVESFILEEKPNNRRSLVESTATALSTDLEALLKAGHFSDIVLLLKGIEFKVHKNILVARSPYFAAIFAKDFKDNRLEVDASIDVEVFEDLLRYMYTDKLENLKENAEDLLIAADLYQMDPLKSACGRYLSGSICADNFCRLLLLANDHHVDELKAECLKYFDGHYKEIVQSEDWVQVMSSSPEMLAVLVQIMALKI